jgi:hypothetical protein
LHPEPLTEPDISLSTYPVGTGKSKYLTEA